MLDSHRKGYAVMSEDLKGISFEDESLECCKKYCRKGNVIAERIPHVSGFQIRVFWANWQVSKIYRHRTGRVVYPPIK